MMFLFCSARSGTLPATHGRWTLTPPIQSHTRTHISTITLRICRILHARVSTTDVLRAHCVRVESHTYLCTTKTQLTTRKFVGDPSHNMYAYICYINTVYVSTLDGDIDFQFVWSLSHCCLSEIP